MSRGTRTAEPAATWHVNRTLDSIRGVAALLVVLGHSRLFFETLAGSTFTQLPVLQRVLLVPTTVAKESVALFFVLSGYLVGGQILRQNRVGRFSWADYATRRLSRLWTVLVPGIILTVLVALVARYALRPEAIAAGGNTGARTAICNVLFLQGSKCGDYGSDISLWSLSYEFWFYIVFAAGACMVFAFSRRNYLRTSLNGIVLIAATALFGLHLFVLIPSWLFGVAVAEVANHPRVVSAIQRHTNRYLVLAVGLVGCGMLITNVLQPSLTVLMVIIGVPAAVLTLVAVQVRDSLNGQRFVRSTARLGDWSYSLYVFHAPLLLLLVGAAQEQGLNGGWRLVPAVYVATAIALPACWLVSRATERHTMTVRRLMLDALRRIPWQRRRGEGLPQPAEST